MSKIELVGKIGSIALIDKQHNDIDYNKFARIGRQLRPGFVWVSSGATEIGRLDYFNRNGSFLQGNNDDLKTDYSAQGQTILMNKYREFIDGKYSVRQVLVEHQHFNDEHKRAHLKGMLERCVLQNAIPIVNYNDCVSNEETRKMEIEELVNKNGDAVELIDNDETASQIANLLQAKRLVILTNTKGIYLNPKDEGTLIKQISADTVADTLSLIDNVIKACCVGSSREGANGAAAKLKYIMPCVANGTEVFIASAEYDLMDIIFNRAPSTTIKVKT